MGVEEIQECCEYYIKHKELTDKNVFFILRYLKYRNKTKAYQDTYFCSKRVANINAFRLFKKPQMQELWHCLEQQMQLNLSEGMKAGRLANELNLNGQEKAEVYERLKESQRSVDKKGRKECFLAKCE
ncbi:terminase small subunit [Liquorilactobacillus satsumensis]|uniref:terminase small subunit n=1 Tax=Liquorilactobacillus satsumensis TaxID=259059 RepID=UPI0039EA4A11